MARRVFEAALRVRAKAPAVQGKVTDKMSWSDIPICKEAGLDVDTLMLRGIFMPPGSSPSTSRLHRAL